MPAMDIYFSKDDEFINDLREWLKNNPFDEKDLCLIKKPVTPVYVPVLYGQDNGFYGKKHKPEQIKSWREMRLGEKNPNYGGKAFTEESFRKMRQPKPNKENYKGTPGKITCINKKGKAEQITTEVYHQQKNSGLPMSEWEYVNTRSKVARDRKNNET